MSRLQKWFEQLTGTTAAERQRVARMRELYGRRMDAAASTFRRRRSPGAARSLF